MPEPLSQSPEAAKPKTVTIGETPIYLTEPVAIDGTPVQNVVVLGKDQRSTNGLGSAVILTREPSRKKENRGEMVDKENLNLDRMDEKNWDDIVGIRFRNEAGNAVDVPKVKLTLDRTSDVRHQTSEKPETITIVGLKAYEGRALDLADRSMQKLSRDIGTLIWKQSIGGIYFHERARQYYLSMLKASETPFAEDAIRLAERRATDLYNKKLADSNFVVRIGTQAWEWFKDKTGMRTTIQTLALDEIGRMKAAGEIAGMATLEREAAAVRQRFGTDFDQADKFVRKQLGEKLEILDPEKSEHQPLVVGIKALLKEYALGDIPDKAEFDKRTQEFFKATLKNTRPDIFAEAELYSSSLFDVAENLRAKRSHEGGMMNIEEAMAGMQIRLGLGQMGEVTSLDPTAVEKGIGKVRDVVEWLQKKNILWSTFIFNEAAVGSGLALALAGINFFKTVPAGLIGAGALAGGAFAGWREYGQLHKDYLTHLRERETGATFTETQKRRAWFERFAPQQRSAAEMMTTIQTAMDTGDYRLAMATIADLQARKAVSETGPKRIGLVQYSSREAIESERAALDILASKALSHLSSLSDLGDLGGNAFPEFMEKLTIMQTRVLREGVGVLTTMEDPVNATLNLVSQYAPEANLIKRRWPFSAGTEVKAAGLDAIMDEFKKEARLEAAKYGVKAGVVGAAIGAAFHGVGELFANRVPVPEAPHEALGKAGVAAVGRPDLPPVEHTYSINGAQWQTTLPPGYSLVPQPEHGGWLLEDGGKQITFLQFNADGNLANKDIVNAALSAHGAAMNLTDIAGSPPTPETVTFAPPDMTIDGKSLGEGGIWDYFLDKTGNVTEANGMKNLFRLYAHEHGVDTDFVTFGENNSNPYDHALRFRDASFGEQADIDLTRIPNDAQFHLPTQIFGENGITEFHKLNEAALQRMNELLASGDKDILGPMHAINKMYEGNDQDQLYATVLKLGYVGQDDKLPDADHMKLIYEKLGAYVNTPGDSGTLPVHTLGITETATAGSIPPALHTPADDLIFRPEVTDMLRSQQESLVKGTALPWITVPLFARMPLEASASAETTAKQAPERKPQKQAVAEYLATLSDEEKQLVSGQDLPPVSPNLRAAVLIPVSHLHGTNITGRLSSYTNQEGLDATEFLVFDTLGVKDDVDTFMADHPEMKILYVKGPEGTAGKIKRDATNILLGRIATLPENSPDAAVVMDSGTGGTLSPTYLSGIISTLDADTSLDAVGGAYTLPADMYTAFPMLFAQYRAVELMDALVRHGESGGIPPAYAGNLAVRSGSLAQAGGYSPDMPFGEDRMLAMKLNSTKTIADMTAEFSPEDMSYAMLQSLKLADPAIGREQNETYKTMSWEDMAKKAQETFTKEHLDERLTQIYQRYPGRDAMFKRTMEMLGLPYEIQDGKVTVLSTEGLASNMAAPIDIEEFAKVEVKQTVTPREHLENLAGDTPETPAEISAETLGSSLSSPDLSALSHVSDVEEKPQKTEPLPAGVEDRMNYVLGTSKESRAAVRLTPGELMDYLKTSVDIDGTRITGGKIDINGATVTLTDIIADVRKGAARIGDAKFSATLTSDPEHGLVIDHQTLKMELPFMLRLAGGTLKKRLGDFHQLVLGHLNSRIDPAWQAERIDVVGEKLEVKFGKKLS